MPPNDDDPTSQPTRRSVVLGSSALAGLAALGINWSLPDPAAAITGPWGGFSNGQIPLSSLQVVSYPRVSPDPFPGGLAQVYLKPDAAAAMMALLRDYHSSQGAYLGVCEGYRSYAGQQYWWDYWGHNPSFGAYPGTSSHGWGQAVDFIGPTAPELQWLRANCAQYGYSPIQSETWHFNYTGTFTASAEEEDMPIFEIVQDMETNTGVWFVVNRMQRYYLSDIKMVHDYQYFLDQNGHNSRIQNVGRIRSFGVIVK